MAILNYKIKEYTLIETIVSMVIIMLVFSISMMIYINVVRTDRVIERTQVFLKMNEILTLSKSKQDFLDFTYSFENYEIKKSIQKYMDLPALKVISVKAYNKQGKLIAEKSELFLEY